MSPTPSRRVRNYNIELPKFRRLGEPENYRFTAARIAQKEEPTFSTPVHFRLRTRYISAFGAKLTSEHPHVLLLRIPSSATARFISHCCGLLPRFVQSWVKALFPEWFLPDHVVLKSQKRGEEEMIMRELFDTELKAYDRLKPLQGVVIPRCYGSLHYNGARALILEHVGGVSPSTPEGSTLKLEALSDLLQVCYRALHSFGVHHDDPQLGNFQFLDGRIMVLDLERVMFDLSLDDNAFYMKTSIEELAIRYRDRQAYFRRNGFLEAA
ncbi:hypothetical protein MFIFM68171_00149 [Madurella fahalii]|uniref:Uncharacterized protein n=1 Tax=Madurella fahalii TaxID=1157608 RepID=A0ABQ0FWS5_9PEZI